MKAKENPIWILEEEAAKTIGLQPRTLRRYVKEGRLPISYATLHGRSFRYDLRGIRRVLSTGVIHQ